MRVGLLIGVLIIALALPGASAQRMCRIESQQYGTVEYPCGSGESAPEEGTDDEPWWASGQAQMILGVIGLVASAGAGGYTVYRVRSRRQALTVNLAAIETAYTDAKSDPENGIARLCELRAQVRDDHQKGRLDDVHFLELDRRVTQSLVKLRLLEIDRRFATLPPLLLAEIRRLLSDGTLSQSEADLIEVRTAAYRIHDATREELIALTRRWANDDGPRDHGAATEAVAQ